MPKAASRRNRQSKVQPFETMMVDESKVEEIVEVTDNSVESNHSVHKRQVGEWKKMKSEVAKLKSQRKALSKNQRDVKKDLSKQIKFLIASTRSKHDAELQQLGIVPPKSSDLMMDDDIDD